MLGLGEGREEVKLGRQGKLQGFCNCKAPCKIVGVFSSEPEGNFWKVWDSEEEIEAS